MRANASRAAEFGRSSGLIALGMGAGAGTDAQYPFAEDDFVAFRAALETDAVD